MADALDAIKLAIADPDVVTESDTLARKPEGERLVISRTQAHPRYPSLYVRVPVEYCDGPAPSWVTTAYLHQLPPKGDVLYVRLTPPR